MSVTEMSPRAQSAVWFKSLIFRKTVTHPSPFPATALHSSFSARSSRNTAPRLLVPIPSLWHPPPPRRPPGQRPGYLPRRRSSPRCPGPRPTSHVSGDGPAAHQRPCRPHVWSISKSGREPATPSHLTPVAACSDCRGPRPTARAAGRSGSSLSPAGLHSAAPSLCDAPHPPTLSPSGKQDGLPATVPEWLGGSSRPRGPPNPRGGGLLEST